MFFIPYAPPADARCQPPAQRRHVNRFAMLLFVLTFLAGLLLKYLPG